MNDVEPPYMKWRTEIRNMIKLGKEFEAEAKKHPEIPFVVDVSLMPGLSVNLSSVDIQEFSSMVRRVAAIFGQPTSVKPFSDGEEIQSLWAEWCRYPNATIRVCAYSPKGCRIDPRTEYVAEQKVLIHPECKAVLAELEEVGSEACEA